MGDIAREAVRQAQGSCRTIGRCSGCRTVLHGHSAPHQLALHVLWEEHSSSWFSSRRTPGFGKGNKGKGDLYSWGGHQLYVGSAEEGCKHFYDTKYSQGVYAQQTLHPDLHHGVAYSPVLSGLVKTSPFSSLPGSAVSAIRALALRRAPWGTYQGTQGCKHLFFLCPVLQGTQPGRSLPGSKQAAAPRTWEVQLLPRATFLSQVISTLHWNSCNLWPEIFQKRLEGLQAFLDAERGCKHFGMLRGTASILGCSARRGPYLEEEVLGSFRGSGAFVGNTASLQTVESPGFFVGLSKGAPR